MLVYCPIKGFDDPRLRVMMFPGTVDEASKPVSMMATVQPEHDPPVGKLANCSKITKLLLDPILLGLTSPDKVRKIIPLELFYPTITGKSKIFPIMKGLVF